MITTPNTSYDYTGREFTDSVVLKSGVTWKGGKFTGSGPAFTSTGSCVGSTILGVELAPSMRTLLDASMKPFLTYDGTDNTFLYKNLLVDGVKISGKTTLYDGPWEATKTFHNVSFGITIKNVVRTYDANSSNTLVFGASNYKFKGENWTLIGDDNHAASDNGVVYINGGNAQLKNIYRKGKQYGYVMRCIAAKLGTDPDQDVKVINTVDAETVCYGSMDIRMDAGLLQTTGAIPISGCNAYFTNNTSGNKTDMNAGYVTNAVIAGEMQDDQGKQFSIFINNSLAFGAFDSAMDNNSSLLKNNSNGKATIVITNCTDIPPGKPVPTGIVDADYYGLTPIGAQRAAAPPPVKQRSVVYNNFDGKLNKWTYFYDDGSIQ